MKEAELLLTTAEVAVAFAGFASLVSFLGRRFGRDDPRIDAVRLRGMLEISLITVAFALFPFVPGKFGTSQIAVWQISSAAFALSSIASFPFTLLRARRLFRAGFRPSRFITGFVTVVVFLADTALLLNALRFFPEAAAAVYFAALYANLSVAGLLFYRVITSLLIPPEVRAE